MTATENTGGEYPSVSEHVQAKPEGDEGLVFPLRVRISDSVDTDLNRIEAFFRGEGYRHANRSHLIRVALQRLINDVYSEHPEVDVPTTREQISGSENVE